MKLDTQAARRTLTALFAVTSVVVTGAVAADCYDRVAYNTVMGVGEGSYCGHDCTPSAGPCFTGSKFQKCTNTSITITCTKGKTAYINGIPDCQGNYGTVTYTVLDGSPEGECNNAGQ